MQRGSGLKTACRGVAMIHGQAVMRMEGFQCAI